MPEAFAFAPPRVGTADLAVFLMTAVELLKITDVLFEEVASTAELLIDEAASISDFLFDEAASMADLPVEAAGLVADFLFRTTAAAAELEPIRRILAGFVAERI